MKHLILIVFAFMSIGLVSAQDVVKEDLLIIGEPSGSRYLHIDFPRKNIIIKRGGIASFKSVIGEEVIVESTSKNKRGSTMVTLRRKDGIKFFRHYRTVKANLDKALASAELRRKK